MPPIDPENFLPNLESYTGSLRRAEAAISKMDIREATEASQAATTWLVACLQNLDGRLARLECRLPANDA